MSMDTIDFSRLPLGGQRVLDVGCGEGRHCLSAAYHGAAQVVGIDLAEQDLATARKRQHDFESGHGALSPITFMKGSALDLPFEDGSFDGVLCSEVLEHIFPYETAIAEIVRVVRPGGWVALSVPRAWPEKICWALSDAYHEAAGGHIRIFEEPALQRGGGRGPALRGTLRRPCVARTLLVAALPLWWGRRRHRSLARAPLAQAFAVGPSRGPGPHPNARALAESRARKKRDLPLPQAHAMSRVLLTQGQFPEALLRPTVNYIARCQLSSGAIPWFPEGKIDPWDHLESAMGLAIGGAFEEARAAFAWLEATQRADGSWPATFASDGTPTTPRAESNFVAYGATALYHYFLCAKDLDTVERFWPMVRRALSWVLALQSPEGDIAWARDEAGRSAMTLWSRAAHPSSRASSAPKPWQR